MPDSATAIWLICALAIAGVILRPFRLPEWLFATAGAVLLVVAGLLPPAMAARGIASGLDVYLFLAGMMMLAEVARREGLFAYLAIFAARYARGAPHRLFVLVYCVGIVVTTFLSNDATAVVLTPAVAAVARAAGVKTPMPYLLACAFVANAASFALPISNPANIVVFDGAMPPLVEWLTRFGLASMASILSTLVLLWLTQRRDLAGDLGHSLPMPALSHGGRIAALGLALAAAVLIAASAAGLDLGWPTAAAGLATLLAVLVFERSSPWPVVRSISWDTLVLVAGLFVIVRALETTELTDALAERLQALAASWPSGSLLLAGALTAVATNLTNNLPLGLLSGSIVTAGDLPSKLVDAVLVGIDLGPNLSVTGSLATILWLSALRREGLSFGALQFLKIGAVVMPPALVLSLAALLAA